MPTARAGVAAAKDPDGKIYALGGNNNTQVLSTVEIYGP
jgi:Kelch motif